MLLTYPFRPFFLLTGLYGALLIPAWLSVLWLSWPVLGYPPPAWHAHEVLFGLVPAAIAGFLLTAMCTWTGSKPLAGWKLAALAGVWLAGRTALWLPAWFPPPAAALVDLAFLLLVALLAAYDIIRARNWRNLVMIGLPLALFAANLLMHLEFRGIYPAGPGFAQRLTIDLIILLMAVVAGRITPAFTANWLRRQGGDPAAVRQYAMLDRLALGLTALVAASEFLGPAQPASAILALAAGLLHCLRLAGWGAWHCRREPLLWVLHLGYAWIAAALLLKGLPPWLDGVAPSVWYHAAGVGAMGTLILGVMTRVALGHTGRPLVLPRGGVLIYWSITAAALLRLGQAFGLGPDRHLLLCAGAAWSAAFLLFLVLYWPILSRPRADAAGVQNSIPVRGVAS